MAGAIQLGLQVIGIVVVAAYSGFMTFVFLKVIDLIMGIRVDIADELEGNS
jgi:ammonia channel protein AmtB